MVTRYLLIRGVLRRRGAHLDSRCARKASYWRSDQPLRQYSYGGRKWSTPLAQKIGEAIATTGPISIAAFMRQCLTAPAEGYYTSSTRSNEQIGQKGDFITSPEISQIFGELVAVWFVSQWMAQGRPGSGVCFVELGPGNGTLIDDILRTMRNFKSMSNSIAGIYLVEASQTLREQQHQRLCGLDASLEETETGWQSRSKYANIPVVWVEDIRSLTIANDQVPFIIAHEFFDALPIQAFQSISPRVSEENTLQGLHGPIRLNKAPSHAEVHQWRELLVNSAAYDTPAATSGTQLASSKARFRDVDFQLTLAKASNPSSMLLPEASERYRALKNRADSVIEVSPESQAICAEFARLIGGGNDLYKHVPPETSSRSKSNPSGAALIIDYGPSCTIPTNTLRGIRSHKQVSPFSSPGEVDLSADVDFTALAEAAIDASEGVEVHGPVEQGEWLGRMGIHERAKALSDTAAKNARSEENIRNIKASVQRLTERGGGAMGKVYKVMAIVPESGGQRPVGFGGGVRT